ncbi:MAG: cobalamin-dependent protein [Gemmatimonadaceae bacterium]
MSDRTGLTPDVLRVWERRYGVVEPKRSPGGQRIYSDADIERLSLLHRATRGGHGISHVASLSKTKLEEIVRGIEPPAAAPPFAFIPIGEPDSLVRQAIAFTDALDPVGLESLLRRSLSRYGLVTVIDSIAAPFLREVGERWHDGLLSISQEHLATAVLQRVVSDSAPLMTGVDGSPTIVIATLDGEPHANGALMAAATAGSEGWRVIYLGTDLPVSEIIDTAIRTRAEAIGISMVFTEKKSRIATELRDLEARIPPNVTLIVGGAGAKSVSHSDVDTRVIFLKSMSELRAELAQLRSRRETTLSIR